MPEIVAQSACPLPVAQKQHILLAHGSGGKLMHELIDSLFKPRLLGLQSSDVLNDAYVFEAGSARLAVTTDTFVVDPIFFPGGNIGTLAVNGTINDLAVSGASPVLLTCAFILEEGFAVEDLEAITDSMRHACASAGVRIASGDTKVVNRGGCDKIFINTTGLGILQHGLTLSANSARPGDVILINGDIASHGMAVMSARENFEFETPIFSDTAALHGLIVDMLQASNKLRVMRDLTRGGLASALNEIASSSAVGIKIYQDRIPLQDEVKGLCEILGLDPLHVANEGKLIAIADREEAEAVLAAMVNHPLGQEASIIGEVVEDRPGMVVMQTGVGGWRVVDMLTGEQLPRIC